MSTRTEWTLRLIALAALAALFVSLTACQGLPLRSVTVDGDRATVCMTEGQCETVPRSELATHIAKKGYPSSTIRVAQALASAPPSNTPPKAHLFDEETLWLGRALYSESKRSYESELNAWVIRNRVQSDRFPDTYKEVVLQSRQFSAFNDPDARRRLSQMGPEDRSNSWVRALRMAVYVSRAPQEINPLPDTTWHFLSPHVLSELPKWAKNHKPIYKIGNRFHYYAGVD